MNYRHAYHAGNFADVMKHVILVALIDYLKRKDKAFRVIDIHSGIGIYDLQSQEAEKTLESQEGILNLLKTDIYNDLINQYIGLVQKLNQDAPPNESVRVYPGSPKISRMMLRKQDRLTLTELHPDDHRELAQNFSDDFQTRVIHLDGWLALGSFVPPKEKRGLVLIDPPYEKPDDFKTIATQLAKALKRWQGGTYAVWYPLKDRKQVASFQRDIAALGMEDTLSVELWVQDAKVENRLNGSGVIVINPPYILKQQLEEAMPLLAKHLAQDKTAHAKITTLS